MTKTLMTLMFAATLAACAEGEPVDRGELMKLCTKLGQAPQADGSCALCEAPKWRLEYRAGNPVCAWAETAGRPSFAGAAGAAP
jgi:hypothetical protein